MRAIEKYGVAFIRTNGTVVESVRNELFTVICEQLPRAVRERVGVNIKADAHMIRVEIEVTELVPPNRKWKVQLQDGDLGGRRLPCRIPDEFIAMLCVSA